MLKFDRLKLATSSHYITNLNPTQFLEIPMKQGDYYYKYHQDCPFSLTITNKPQKSELVIDFTGKVLKDAYHSLISRETIRQCFDNICAMNICNLDVYSQDAVKGIVLLAFALISCTLTSGNRKKAG